MPGNSFGSLFRITNWGESHGKAIGVVVDGCPALLELNEGYIQKFLDRRMPGQSEVTTQRQEPDNVEIISGLFNGRTTGTPISMIIFNKDYRKEDYKDIAAAFRPSHADFTYQKKFGIRDTSGGGRSSARLTAGNVAAGAIAYKILNERFGVEVVAYVKQIKDIQAEIDSEKVSKKDVDSNMVRCPDKNAAKQMIKAVEDAKNSGDSVGGIIECIIRNVPIGLGEPIFDKLEADLAKAMLCINATKGFEIGSGFEGKTNNSGGVQGGISNGMPIIFRVAFKPTSTIQKEQDTVDIKGKSVKLAAKGRHDPCVLPRAVPIVEAMAALVLCDHYLRQRAQNGDKFDS